MGYIFSCEWFAACNPYFFYAEGNSNRCNSYNLFIAQNLFMRNWFYSLGSHAVNASEVTAVSNRNAKIVYLSAIMVFHCFFFAGAGFFCAGGAGGMSFSFATCASSESGNLSISFSRTILPVFLSFNL